MSPKKHTERKCLMQYSVLETLTHGFETDDTHIRNRYRLMEDLLKIHYYKTYVAEASTLAREPDEAAEAKHIRRAEGGCDEIYQTRPARRKADPNLREQGKAELW